MTYHLAAVEPEAAGHRLRCRDLRTRNLSTRFGELELRLDAAGRPVEGLLHV